MWVLLDDFFHSHPLPVTGQDDTHPNACAGNYRASTAAVGDFFDVAVIDFGHGSYLLLKEQKQLSGWSSLFLRTGETVSQHRLVVHVAFPGSSAL
jgi:hypothetical protein